MNDSVLKKVLPYLVSLFVAILLFLVMLAPILEVSPKDILPIDSNFNLYDEVKNLNSEYLDEYEAYKGKVTNLEVIKDSVKEYDELIKEADSKEEKKTLEVMRDATKMDIMLYGTTIAMEVFLSLLLIVSVASIALFYVKDGVKYTKYLRYAIYVFILAIFIISCIMVGGINSVGKGFESLDFRLDLVSKSPAALLSLSLIATLGFAVYEYLVLSGKTLKGLTKELNSIAANNINTNSEEQNQVTTPVESTVEKNDTCDNVVKSSEENVVETKDVEPVVEAVEETTITTDNTPKEEKE